MVARQSEFKPDNRKTLKSYQVLLTFYDLIRFKASWQGNSYIPHFWIPVFTGMTRNVNTA